MLAVSILTTASSDGIDSTRQTERYAIGTMRSSSLIFSPEDNGLLYRNVHQGRPLTRSMNGCFDQDPWPSRYDQKLLSEKIKESSGEVAKTGERYQGLGAAW